MKRDPDFFGDEELLLLFIGSRLRDAKRLEERLTAAGIDYLIEVDHYKGGFLFPSMRAGAFFYCREPDVARAKAEVLASGFRPYTVEEPS